MPLHRLLGFGFESNVYLIEDEINALIDTGTGFYSDTLMKEIERYVDIESIEYIIITHEHFDHCGGAKRIKEESGAKICMHEKGAKVLEEREQWSATFFNSFQEKVKVEKKLKEGDKIILGNMNLEVLYTPGHSPGSICLYNEESKSLFSGDLIFAGGGIGRTDFYGGDAGQLVESIIRIGKLDVENLYPGHGEYVTGNAKKHIKMAEQMCKYLL